MQAAAGQTSEPSCGKNEHLFGESCFWVRTDYYTTWSEAQIVCRARGMELASLHSQEENDFLWGVWCWKLFIR